MSVSSPLPETQPPSRSEAPDRRPDARVALAESGRVKDLSGQARPLLQGPSDDYVGHLVYALLPSPLNDRVRAAIQETTSERQPVTFDGYHAEVKEWVAIQVEPTTEGVELLVHDITPRKESERWLHLLDSTALEGLWEVGPSDTLVSVNDAFARFLG